MGQNHFSERDIDTRFVNSLKHPIHATWMNMAPFDDQVPQTLP